MAADTERSGRDGVALSRRDSLAIAESDSSPDVRQLTACPSAPLRRNPWDSEWPQCGCDRRAGFRIRWRCLWIGLRRSPAPARQLTIQHSFARDFRVDR